MPFTEAPRVPVSSGEGSGVSISMQVAKSGAKVRISLKKEVQEDHFGGSIIGQKFKVMIGRGVDEGLLQIRRDDTGEAVATASTHGGASIKVGRWDLLPKDKRPAQQCEIKQATPDMMVLKLPGWCKPSGAGGKMEQEHGLKRAGAMR